MMFSIIGELRNVFEQERTDRDTGEVQTKHRIQILGDIPVPGDRGETRLELVTLNVEEPSIYRGLLGKQIRVPFGFFAPSKGQVITFVPKGAKPQVVSSPQAVAS